LCALTRPFGRLTHCSNERDAHEADGKDTSKRMKQNWQTFVIKTEEENTESKENRRRWSRKSCVEVGTKNTKGM
jgi:hypothetical protein